MEVLGYLLAQSFHVTMSQVVKTTDDRGGPTDRTLTAGWYRTFLCGAGTAVETDPTEFLGAIQAALGATKWSVNLRPDGHVQLTYTGTGTGTLNLSTSTMLRALLGFDTNVGPLASNSVAVGAYLPTHCVFSAVCDPDTGWTDGVGRFAGAEMPDGTVYGFDDGRLVVRRNLGFRLLPKDWTARAGIVAAETGTAPGTPAFGPTTRRLSPAIGEPAQAPPWGAIETLATATGRQCGFTEDLQRVVAGSLSTFDVVYLTVDTRTSGGRLTLSIERYDPRRDLALSLLWNAVGTR